MNKEQKIKKIFETDEEIAKEMLEEIETRRARRKDHLIFYKRFAHLFRIHSFGKTIQSRSDWVVKKCDLCGLLKIKNRCLQLPKFLLNLFILLLGLIFTIVGITEYIKQGNFFFLLFIPPGICCLYYVLKASLERIWMGGFDYY